MMLSPRMRSKIRIGLMKFYLDLRYFIENIYSPVKDDSHSLSRETMQIIDWSFGILAIVEKTDPKLKFSPEHVFQRLLLMKYSRGEKNVTLSEMENFKGMLVCSPDKVESEIRKKANAISIVLTKTEEQFQSFMLKWSSSIFAKLDKE